MTDPVTFGLQIYQLAFHLHFFQSQLCMDTFGNFLYDILHRYSEQLLEKPQQDLYHNAHNQDMTLVKHGSQFQFEYRWTYDFSQ